MADPLEELNERFSRFVPPPSMELPSDVSGELQSIMRLYSLSPEDLFYKWESYGIKMGSDETKLNLDTVRAFKKDVQDTLERESRSKVHVRAGEKKSALGATPRNVSTTSDVFDILDGLSPNTPSNIGSAGSRKNGLKRRAPYDTPLTSKSTKILASSSPAESATPGGPHLNGRQHIPFQERTNAGQILEVLNEHLVVPDPPSHAPAEPRIKLTSNTDLKKFSYRPMAMHLSEASEVLDDRIDEIQTLVQDFHSLDDSNFGNPASQSTSEIVAVGRIASDTLESKLSPSSLLLETSRRIGAGLRVPLKVDSLPTFQFFPGQIVALRGTNASGEYFSVSEILPLPILPVAVSSPTTLEQNNERLIDATEDDPTKIRPLTILLGSGPYTADDNLEFEPLQTICEKAANSYADAVILTGPFLDTEHPLLATGDFDLPSHVKLEPDSVTLSSLFRAVVAGPIRQLAEAVPSITIIIVPSVRDAISKHVSWPQDSLARKDLGLPKQARCVTNPVTISFNEFIIGISAQDILYELRREEVVGGKPKEPNILARTARHIIDQRHFFPLFPPVARENLPKPGFDGGLATGAMLDISYLKLGEWLNVRPDILVTPSTLAPFAKVVENVLVVNPGSLSKRKGPGTYAAMTVYPSRITEEERQASNMIPHKIFERARVDVTRI